MTRLHSHIRAKPEKSLVTVQKRTQCGNFGQFLLCLAIEFAGNYEKEFRNTGHDLVGFGPSIGAGGRAADGRIDGG